MLPSVVFTHLNDSPGGPRWSARPVRIARGWQAASSSAPQQPRPSVATAARGQPVLGAARDLGLRKPLTGASYSPGAPRDWSRPPGHEGRLARRAAAPLAAWRWHSAEMPRRQWGHRPPWATDRPVSRVSPLAPRRENPEHDLVLHGPRRRRGLLDPETAAEFHVGGCEMRRSSPSRSGGWLRVSAAAWSRGRSCPPWAMSASCSGCIDRGPARQHAMLPMAAAGADEAVRPAQPDQRRAALLLGAEGLAKRLVAQTTHARCNLEPHNRDPLHTSPHAECHG